MAKKQDLFTMEELSGLQGAVSIPMTNDYLFRALLQENNRVLKAIICALLHLDPKRVREVTVENPIELGKSYDEKDFILDIKALLDGNLITNLEMQVINEYNWQNRSLCYLCRSFDQLNRGDTYNMTRPVVQIGFLNFTLFPETPEFYATYSIMNEKTYQKYSDKLRLAVVDLTQIELATEADRAYGIDLWAKFFKCKDWSELIMLAKENSDIQAAVGTVYQLSREEKIRQQCEAREDYYRRENDRRLLREKEEEEIKRGREELKREEEKLKREEEELKRGEEELKHGEEELKRGEEELKRGEEELKRGEEELKRKAIETEQKEQALAKQEQALKERERVLEQRLKELEQKQKMASLS